MDKVRQWSVIISVLSIVGSVLSSIVPQGSVKKSYRILISVIIIYAVFSALFSIEAEDLNFDFSSDNVYASVQDESDELILKQGQEIINNTVENKLLQSGIECECESIIYFEENKIVIKKISLKGEFTDDEKKTIKSILGGFLEKEISLEFKGD